MSHEALVAPMPEDQTSPFVRPNGPATTDILSSYNGSNVVFRILRLSTWGPALMNLGYYNLPRPLALFNFVNQELAQQRLVNEALKLLRVKPGNHVLDVACGRGKSSFMTQCSHPDARVVGVDLLATNIQVARTLFDQVGDLTYEAGNAMDLQFPDKSFDRVMCLEAAFHFPDRAKFLSEAYRVLRPGGQLLVVDFAWNTDAERSHRDDAETRLVRQIWQWEDLFSIPQYVGTAEELGFRIDVKRDWSRRVTAPLQRMFHLVCTLGKSTWGRRLLERINPMYRSISAEDWKQAAYADHAHDHVQRHSKYMAFLFTKV